MKPSGQNIKAFVKDMVDSDGNHIDSCPHPKQVFYVNVDMDLEPYDIMRFRP